MELDWLFFTSPLWFLTVKKQTKKQHPINVKRTFRHAFRQALEQDALNISPIASKPPPGRSQGVPSEPDLRQSVTLDCWRDGRPRYVASLDGVEHSLPDLPLNDLLKGLFPSAFPSRIESPQDFLGSSVLDLPRLGRTSKPNGSPWTEVAMHLTEELQPGHY